MELSLVVARAFGFWAIALLFGGAGLVLALDHGSRAATCALRVAAGAAAVSGIAWFTTVFITTTDSAASLIDPEAWSAFFSAPFGWPWIVRLLLCCMAAIAALTQATRTFLVLGVAFIVDQAWLGHAASDAGVGEATQFLFYWLHVFAASAWTGALLMLSVFAAETKRVPTEGLALFSSVGVLIVAAIVASGIVNAAMRGISLPTMTSSLYGQILIAKLALFSAMLGFAAFNRLRCRELASRGALRLSLACETVLGLAVLGVAALLGTTAPP